MDTVGQDDTEDSQSVKSGRLTLESITYFKRVGNVLEENTFEDDDHKEAFVKNVFHQIQTEGMQLARHHTTSRVLEDVIPLFTSEQYRTFMELLQENIVIIACDRFGSHVVEQFCKQIENHCTCDVTVGSFVDFCKTIKAEVDSLLRDSYGSHVLSTLLQVLSGVSVPDVFANSRSLKSKNATNKKKKKKKKASLPKGFQKVEVNFKDDITVVEVADSLKKLYLRFVKVIKGDDNFGELLCHHCACPVLQVLLITLSRIDEKKFAEVAQLIISKGRIPFHENANEEVEEDEETIDRLPVVLADSAGSYLFEVLLQTADEETFNKLSVSCLKQIAASLSLHPTGNFLLQTLLRCTKSHEQANQLVKKLIPLTEDILASGHMGCIVRLAELIARLEMVDYQKLLLKAIKESLHIPCDDEEDTALHFVKLVVSMMTYDIFYKLDDSVAAEEKTTSSPTLDVRLEKNMINYHGACLLKNCLEFEKSRTVVNSMLKTSAEELVLIACHPSGSFAFESYLGSRHIKRKQKNKLTEKLRANLSDLARDKFGSRVVERMYSVVAEATQHMIQEELTKSKSKLLSDMYGRIVLSNCDVEGCSRKKEFMQRVEKTRRDFQDIIPLKDFDTVTESKILPHKNTHNLHTDKRYSTNDDDAQPEKKKKKKNENDRVAKYQAQLKSLGITFD